MKKLPFGMENFKEIISSECYYVDKTSIIKKILDNSTKITLFTRPRRFGKSLNMSMIKNFFEIGCDKSLFNGLNIAKETELCEQYMGKYPVISLSLKGVNGYDFEMARGMMCSIIGMEALRFQFLLESDELTDKEKLLYEQLVNIDKTQGFVMSDYVLVNSLRTLSYLLQKHYHQKVIILIDEYDVPLAKAFDKEYYEKMVTLIRLMFEQALKTNDSLYFAIMTGCLRISKESIFTGLNNLKVLSITDVECDEYFGFTDQEVQELLSYYGLSSYYDTVKLWYDGYRFGNVGVYCPWDVICYCNALRFNPKAQPEAYWSNTSGNDIIRKFLDKAKPITKREIERLIDGEGVTKEVRQELTYRELYDSIENIWSVLFTTGYLTKKGESDGRSLKLVIPNMEIKDIFVKQILEWTQDSVQQDGVALEVFCEALKNGEASNVEKQFQAYLRKTISIRDTFVRNATKENFYHGILIGLLGFKDTWGVFSNKESGDGYTDILVEIYDEDIGIIIEVKYADDGDLDASCKEALEQIEEKRYNEQLQQEGMQTILKYGIACFQKRCKVMLVTESQ